MSELYDADNFNIDQVDYGSRYTHNLNIGEIGMLESLSMVMKLSSRFNIDFHVTHGVVTLYYTMDELHDCLALERFTKY